MHRGRAIQSAQLQAPHLEPPARRVTDRGSEGTCEGPHHVFVMPLSGPAIFDRPAITSAGCSLQLTEFLFDQYWHLRYQPISGGRPPA